MSIPERAHRLAAGALFAEELQGTALRPSPDLFISRGCRGLPLAGTLNFPRRGKFRSLPALRSAGIL